MKWYEELGIQEHYYADESVCIINGDCRDILPLFPDKSFDLVLTDPPYNIHKDIWDKIPDYINWCGDWILDSQRFYFFHNDMPIVADLMTWIKNNTNFVFKQFIIWNKRFNEAKNKGYLDGFVVPDGLRNYQQMAEYILFYTFQDRTGLAAVMLDTNNFSTLRKYFKEYQQALGLTKIEIINKIGQQADHCFRWGSSQWDMPTSETYQALSTLTIDNEFVRREGFALLFQ
jgi:hypothetical protein